MPATLMFILLHTSVRGVTRYVSGVHLSGIQIGLSFFFLVMRVFKKSHVHRLQNLCQGGVRPPGALGWCVWGEDSASAEAAFGFTVYWHLRVLKRFVPLVSLALV